MPLAPALVLSAAALALAVPAEPAAAVTPITQTLQLGTNGSPSGPTKIVYTCSEPSPVCGPQLAPMGRWTYTLTVPSGTLVWIHAEKADPAASGANPDCWISDQSGRVIASGQGTCVFQAPPLPPPPAPAAS